MLFRIEVTNQPAGAGVSHSQFDEVGISTGSGQVGGRGIAQVGWRIWDPFVVSVRGSSKRSGGSNKVSALFSRLGTDTADPLARLRALAASNRNAKEHHKAIDADTLQEWAEFAAPRTFGLAVRLYSTWRLPEKHPVVHNLVISNVPGPPVPLYFMGARIDALYPLGPVFHGAGLNIMVMSNNGRLHVGIIACRELMPKPWDLAALFPAELDALHKAAVER